MKNFKIILAIVFVLLLSGCKQNEVVSTTSKAVTTTEATTVKIPETTQVTQATPKLNTITSTKKSDYDVTKLSKVSQYSYDIDEDGTKENIVLYTAAGVDKDGKFIWDDGQNWSLVVEDGEQIYKLFDHYVQLGSAYFEFSEYYKNDNKIPTITLVVSEGASFYLENYSYDKANKYFTEELLYSSQDKSDAGISKLFSSIPDIITSKSTGK
jgi:hypothetical protein